MHPAVASFQEWIAREYRPDGTFEGVQALSGGDADLSVRLLVVNKSYYEVRADLARQELQVGFATEGRVVNEEIEQMILDSGGDLDDLLADELCDLGEEPLTMEHFFERPAFRYVVRLPLPQPEALEDTALRGRVKNILKACQILFQPTVDEA